MKSAILIVCFGSTVQSAREQNIAPVVDAIRSAYPTFDVFEAYTSRIVIKRLQERGVVVQNESQAIEDLLAQGYKQIIVQSLHLVGGEEFNKLRQNVRKLVAGHAVDVRFGRPLLFFTGQEEEYPDDFGMLLDALHEEVAPDSEEGVLWIGHGGISPENTAYGVLQLKALESHRYMRVATIESYPTLTDVAIPWRFGESPKRVHVYPLMLVAGDHALHDIMGEEEDSVINQLQAEGFEPVGHPVGLGARTSVQKLYVEHVRDAIEDNYPYKDYFKG